MSAVLPALSVAKVLSAVLFLYVVELASTATAVISRYPPLAVPPCLEPQLL